MNKKQVSESTQQTLYELFKSRIADGDYPVGELLPTEKQLCEKLSTSRYALREAMARLEADGLIQRKRGSGSTVLRRLPLAVSRSHREKKWNQKRDDKAMRKKQSENSIKGKNLRISG